MISLAFSPFTHVYTVEKAFAFQLRSELYLEGASQRQNFRGTLQHRITALPKRVFFCRKVTNIIRFSSTLCKPTKNIGLFTKVHRINTLQIVLLDIYKTNSKPIITISDFQK